ncbi:hypothetical protein L1887_42347 [Cichorium endivia]|nr:hypothetical protein L1887_42347 [Cichorium endivia]
MWCSLGQREGSERVLMHVRVQMRDGACPRRERPKVTPKDRLHAPKSTSKHMAKECRIERSHRPSSSNTLIEARLHATTCFCLSLPLLDLSLRPNHARTQLSHLPL